MHTCCHNASANCMLTYMLLHRGICTFGALLLWCSLYIAVTVFLIKLWCIKVTYRSILWSPSRCARASNTLVSKFTTRTRNGTSARVSFSRGTDSASGFGPGDRIRGGIGTRSAVTPAGNRLSTLHYGGPKGRLS